MTTRRIEFDIHWRWAMLFALLALAVGVYVRLKGLGRWPLAEDEYFMARSVASIVEHGLPAENCRGAGRYLRGIAYQYLVAPFIAAGISSELALRSVALASNLAVLPAVYLLGNRLVGRTLAWTVVGLLALSLWEVEFARFGRMYAPFQTVFVWYVLALHDAVVNDSARARRWMYALSVVGVATWEGGVFLIALNFLPLVFKPGRADARQVLPSAILLVGAVFFLGAGPSGAEHRLPADVAPGGAASDRILLPLLLLPAALGSALGVSLAFAAGIVTILALRRIASASEATPLTRTALAVLVLLAFANQFGLVIASALLFGLIGWLVPREQGVGAMRATAFGVLAIAALWIAFGVLSDDWYALLPDAGGEVSARKFAVIALKYPNVFDSMLFRWWEAMPALTLLVVAAFVLASAYAIVDRRAEGRSWRVVLAAATACMLMVGVLGTRYYSSRYSFFLYPLSLLVLGGGLWLTAQRLFAGAGRGVAAFGAAIALVMFYGEDFGVDHLRRLDTAEYNYRQAVRSGDHFYLREDYRSPADYVNQRLAPGDVVVSTVQTIQFYLDRLDYVYRHHAAPEFAAISCEGGTREKWTDATLIYRAETLFETIDDAGGAVWLLMASAAREPGAPDHAVYEALQQDLVHSGVDGAIDVYRIPPR